MRATIGEREIERQREIERERERERERESEIESVQERETGKGVYIGLRERKGERER